MKSMKCAGWVFLAVCLGTLPSGAFTVTVERVSADVYGLVFPGQTDSYFQVCSAGHPGGPWDVVDMGWNEETQEVWTNTDFFSSLDTCRYYRLRQVALTNAMDVDADGMDDVYEMGWDFLNPLDSGDAQQDYDGDALYNYGEYLYNSSPTNPDSDSDWAIDGYEVYMGTHPANSGSTPALEFRINNNALYTSDTNVSLVFGGLLADSVILADSLTMQNSETNSFGLSVPYSFDTDVNDWRTIYAHLLRTNGGVQSAVMTASIILDTEPPVVTISSPTNGQITDRQWVRLEGVATDTAGTPAVYVNSQHADQVSQTYFTQEKVYLTNGANYIKVEAVDSAGNSVTQQVAVILDASGDTTAPSIVLDIPEDFTVVGGVTNMLGKTTVGSIDALRVVGYTDDEAATVEFFAIHPTGTNGPFPGTLFGTQVVGQVFLGYGTNILLAVASDAAGNQSTNSYIIQADYAFTLEITNPAPGDIISASEMVVSGRASLEFTNATITVNGIAATITTVTNDEAQFSTTAGVSMAGGVTTLRVQAMLGDTSYSYQVPAYRYEYLGWHRDYSNYYSSQYWDGYYNRSIVEGWWSRDDTWRATDTYLTDGIWLSDAYTLVEHHLQDVQYCDYYSSGGSDCDRDIRDETVNTIGYPSRTYGYFGTENIRYDYTVLGGELAWDHDAIWLNDSLAYVCHKPSEYSNMPACIQFVDMSYYRPPGMAVDPSLIHFKGQPGFLLNGHISFLVTNETPNAVQVISEADFTWPAFQYIGERKDRRPWYEADTVSKVHVLHFSDFTSEPVKFTFKQTVAAQIMFNRYVVPSVKRIQIGQDQRYIGFAFPGGTDNDMNTWVAVVEPKIPGEAALYVQRDGVTNALAWSGTPSTIQYVDGVIDHPVRMLRGVGASPTASEVNGVIEISNLKSRDSVVVEHVASGCRSEIMVVDNFGWEQAEQLGLENISFAPEYAALNATVKSNIRNTLIYALDQTPGRQQAIDRVAMAVTNAPLATEDIPSTMGVGAFGPDLFHLHICFTGSIPASAQQALDTYLASESTQAQGLYHGSDDYTVKAVRDSIVRLNDLVRSDMITFLNALVSEPEMVCIYHAYEWLDDGYGGIDPELDALDPIRNLMTNLSATDTARFGTLNTPHLIYTGPVTQYDRFGNYDLHELIVIRFYMDEQGQIKIFIAPNMALHGAIAAMQLHDLLGE